MRKMQFLLLLLLFHFSHTIQSQTFFSLTPGNWNDNSVWSLDGVTPCNCSPATTISGFDVRLRHKVTATSAISILNGDSLMVEAGAHFDCSAFDVDVINGVLYADDSIRIKKLTIDVAGEVTSNTFLELVNGTTNNFGKLNINFSTLIVSSGNIRNQPGALWNLNNSLIVFANGNVFNDGTINLNNSCIYFDSGNASNHATGIITGNGGFNTAGNISNAGSWSPAVDWCAGGSSSGIPIAENCTTNICIYSLPVSFTSMSGNSTAHGNEISWEISSDVMLETFIISRSIHGGEFLEIARIPAGREQSEFQYLDPAPKHAFYQVTGIDISGQTYTSTILEIAGMNEDMDARLQPNFITGSTVLELGLMEEETVTIRVTDVSGRVVKEMDAGLLGAGRHHLNINFDQEASGLYLIRIQTGNGGQMLLKAVKN